MEQQQQLQPSAQQQQVLDSIDGFNVIIDSVAGGGKTTMQQFIAAKNQTKRIIVLTYSKFLKLQGRQHFYKRGLINVEVQSYHSFCYKYYSDTTTDQGIGQIVQKNTQPRQPIVFDIVIIDECQDMNKLYFKLVRKIWEDNEVRDPQLILLGDRFQSIFQYNGSDSRFLTMGDKLFKFFNKREWRFFELNQTYRFTNQIALFINRCVLGFDRLHSKKYGPEPTYVVTSTFSPDYCVNQIKHFLNQGVKPHEIFIISYSVKNSFPIRNICNCLASNGIPVFVPEEGGRLDNDNMMLGKVIVSTIHQVKGRECTVAFIIGFDSSLNFFEKEAKDSYVCPNTIYVAMTRAKKHLYLLQNHQEKPLNFIDMSILPYHADIIREKKQQAYDHKEEDRPLFTTTSLTSHLSSQFTNEVFSQICLIPIGQQTSSINIIGKMKLNQTKEDVTNITTQAILEYFAMKVTNKKHMLQTIRRHNPEFLIQNGIQQNIVDPKPEQLLIMTNYYLSIRTGHDYKMTQIKSYNWLDQQDLDQLLETFNLNCLSNINKESNKELTFNYTSQETINNQSVCAQHDLLFESQEEQVMVNFAFTPEGLHQAVLRGLVGYQALIEEVDNNIRQRDILNKSLERQQEELKVLEIQRQQLTQGWKDFNTLFMEARDLEKGKTCKKGDYVMYMDNNLQVMLSQIVTSSKQAIKVKQMHYPIGKSNDDDVGEDGYREVIEKLSHDQLEIGEDGKKVFISASNPMYKKIQENIKSYEMYNSVKRAITKVKRQIQALVNQLQYSKVLKEKKKKMYVYVIQPNESSYLTEIVSENMNETVKQIVYKMIATKTTSKRNNISDDDFVQSCALEISSCELGNNQNKMDDKEDTDLAKRFLSAFGGQYEECDE